MCFALLIIPTRETIHYLPISDFKIFNRIHHEQSTQEMPAKMFLLYIFVSNRRIESWSNSWRKSWFFSNFRNTFSRMCLNMTTSNSFHYCSVMQLANFLKEWSNTWKIRFETMNVECVRIFKTIVSLFFMITASTIKSVR